MATAQIDAAVEPLASIHDVIDAMDEVYARLVKILDEVSRLPEGEPEHEGWDARRLLSHIIGAWHRVPLHAAFYLAAEDGHAPIVPIRLHDDYWIAEWETAPLEAFRSALRAAYLGNLHFVAELDPAMLSRVGDTPFGAWTLSKLLMVSYSAHIGGAHTRKLAELLAQGGTIGGAG